MELVKKVARKRLKTNRFEYCFIKEEYREIVSISEFQKVVKPY